MLLTVKREVGEVRGGVQELGESGGRRGRARRRRRGQRRRARGHRARRRGRRATVPRKQTTLIEIDSSISYAYVCRQDDAMGFHVH